MLIARGTNVGNGYYLVYERFLTDLRTKMGELEHWHLYLHSVCAIDGGQQWRHRLTLHRCSGIHRGMGTHISRVKSVDLDSWTDEQLQSMIKWGNARANRCVGLGTEPILGSSFDNI